MATPTKSRSGKLSTYRGRFALIRTGRDRSGKGKWLLLHKKDGHSEAGWDPEDHPASVKTGRTNDEVASTATS